MSLGDDAGALSDFDEAVALSRGERGGYFVQRARALARVAMRSHRGEDALAGVQVLQPTALIYSGSNTALYVAPLCGVCVACVRGMCCVFQASVFLESQLLLWENASTHTCTQRHGDTETRTHTHTHTHK